MVQTQASSLIATTILLLCLGLHLHCKIADAATYTVGDGNGWSPNVINWTQGKKFKPDDVLIFNYDPVKHNVVEVDEVSYDTCTLGEGSKTYDTGKDQIVLTKGRHYFISGKGEDCDNQMKIELLAI